MGREDSDRRHYFKAWRVAEEREGLDVNDSKKATECVEEKHELLSDKGD